jgi:threonine dehydrogenase-like Zn-dependent dehydrogenase
VIVVGLDIHKHSLTAVAVDELGRERGAWSGPIGVSVVRWAQLLEPERLWAVEDCRQSRAARADGGAFPRWSDPGHRRAHRTMNGQVFMVAISRTHLIGSRPRGA